MAFSSSEVERIEPRFTEKQINLLKRLEDYIDRKLREEVASGEHINIFTVLFTGKEGLARVKRADITSAMEQELIRHYQEAGWKGARLYLGSHLLSTGYGITLSLDVIPPYFS